MIKIKSIFIFSVFVMLSVFTGLSVQAQDSRAMLSSKSIMPCDTYDMNNYRIEFQTDKVIPLAKELKDKVSSFKGVDMQSFSASKTHSNISFYLPLDKAKKLYEILIDYPQVSSISESKSHVRSSYNTYNTRYKLFELLLNNFDQVESILSTEKCDSAEIFEMKQILEENQRNYKRTLDSYEKQLNMANFQLYIKEEKKE